MKKIISDTIDQIFDNEDENAIDELFNGKKIEINNHIDNEELPSVDDFIQPSVIKQPKKKEESEVVIGEKRKSSLPIFLPEEMLARKKLKIKQLRQGSRPFCRGTQGSIGFDIHSFNELVINKFCTKKIETGFSIELPKGYYGRIAERSSMSLMNLKIGGGVIDPDYTGEIKVIITNLNTKPVVIEKGQHIAQLIIEKAATDIDVELIMFNDNSNKTDFTIAYNKTISDEKRGDKGFGSTGFAEGYC